MKLNNKKYYRDLLKEPLLFRRITEDGLDEAIVGENEARKVVFLCAMGHLVVNSNIASYNLLVNSESGAGKDHLVKNVLLILPPEKVIKRTRISPTVLTYWHNSKFEPSWTWDGKILYLEDCSNNILNHEVFKVMCSSGSFATVTINQKAVDIEIKGKPIMIITSASANPNPELLRRFIIVNLDETKKQTQEVMEKWADYGYSGKIKKEENDYHKALSLLKRIKVKIPFARQIVHYFPATHMVMRTHFSRFLDFIKSSVAIHQYQREKDSDDFYLATGEDYDIARQVLLKTTTNPIMIPLTKNKQRILEIINGLPKTEIIDSGSEEKEKEKWHSVGDIDKLVTFISERQLRKELRELSNLGFLKQNKEKRMADKPVMVYRSIDNLEMNIPKWEEIQKNTDGSNKAISSNGSISSEPNEPNELNFV